MFTVSRKAEESIWYNMQRNLKANKLDRKSFGEMVNLTFVIIDILLAGICCT